MAGFVFGNVGFVGSLGTAPAVVAPAAVYRFACGLSAAYTDTAGNVWTPLPDAQPKLRYTGASAYAGADAQLYDNVIYSEITFVVPLPNGTYALSTNLREAFHNSPSRIQSMRRTGVAALLFDTIDGFQASRDPISYQAEMLLVVTAGSVSLDLIANADTPIWQTLIFTKQ